MMAVQGYRVLGVARVPRDLRVPQGPQDPPEHREILVLRVQQDPRGLQDHKDSPVPQETQVLLDQWEELVHQDHQVRASRVVMANKDHQEHRGVQDLLVLKDQRVPLELKDQ